MMHCYQRRLPRCIAIASMILSLFIASVAYANLAVISSARINNSKTSQETNTQVVLTLNQPVKYTYFTLDKPSRVVLDIDKTQLTTNLTKLSLTNTPIKAIRVGNKDQHIRLVFDLTSKATARAYLLAPELNYRDRLVLSLTQKITTSAHTHKTAANKTPAKADALPLKNASTRDIIVVIDPGHGGKDPGATGVKGTHEKDIVLSISKYLYALMQKEPGLKPVLTRSSDYFVTLRGRLRKARDAKADMFVAIHADAYKDRSAQGASVFALSQRGASSEAARWIAQKENYSELGGVDLSGLDSSDKTLRSVLIDLSQTATIAQSLDIGTSVLTRLGNLNMLHHDTVEQARFVVLKSPDIPSILIETGFLSNPYEERKLRSAAYRKRVARAILAGIKQYFTKHPPRGTLYAAKRAEKQAKLAHRNKEIKYKVHKGDTLSLLAQRYHVSVSAICSRNRLQGSDIHIGQILILPAVT